MLKIQERNGRSLQSVPLQSLTSRLPNISTSGSSTPPPDHHHHRVSLRCVRGLCDCSGDVLLDGRVVGCGWGRRSLGGSDSVQRAPAEALEALGLYEAVVLLHAGVQKTRSAIRSPEPEAIRVNAAGRVKDTRLLHIYYYTVSAAVCHRDLSSVAKKSPCGLLPT